MRYVEVDGAEPTVSIEVNGNNYVFTNESLTRLVEEKESLKAELTQVERRFKSTQFDVREFFQARYETDHHEIVAKVDDVNELLKDIGADELTKSWSATITITATVTGVEAATADAAKKLISDNIEINLETDGDIWIDDVNVSKAYPEA